jgi:hypothetical protein
MGQRKFKKIQKNENPTRGVMICDALPRKNTKHGIQKSRRKNLHKKSHQAGLQLSFYPIDHGLCKFERKLLNFDPIFGRDVHLSMANNFCN